MDQHRRTDGSTGLGSASAGSAGGQCRRRPSGRRQVRGSTRLAFHHAQLGRNGRPRRCHGKVPALAPALHPGWTRVGPVQLQEDLGRSPGAVRRGSGASSGSGSGGNVLPGVLSLLRLGAHRRGNGGLVLVRDGSSPGSAILDPRPALQFLLYERGPWRSELRPGAQDHTQPLHRQSWTPSGHSYRGRLGRPAPSPARSQAAPAPKDTPVFPPGLPGGPERRPPPES